MPLIWNTDMPTMKGHSFHDGKSVRKRITLLLCVKIVVTTLFWTRDKLHVKYYANEKSC